VVDLVDKMNAAHARGDLVEANRIMAELYGKRR
jgi:hypothetical protein